ncbi:MAG TPA: hypothetical protein DCY17_00740, partial [Clostridiales bacterium]|nr:hypothetical protein [Clostridiales bacterium]
MVSDFLRPPFYATQAPQGLHPAGLAAPTESEIRFGRDYAVVHAQYRFQSLVTLIFITRSVDFRRVPTEQDSGSVFFLL